MPRQPSTSPVTTIRMSLSESILPGCSAESRGWFCMEEAILPSRQPKLDLFRIETTVLRVKGSGWDLAAIEPVGLPAVRLEPLLKLEQLEQLSDEAMVNYLRGCLMDSSAPTPSVETLLHAFLPHKYIDHSHAADVLALVDQESGENVARQVFGDRVGYVPYIMPGFSLAKAAAHEYRRNPQVEGLVLIETWIVHFR